ncbi:MAG: hypothetical protein AB7O79_11280 [Xanthobacteraceae bacterium]
MPLFDQARFAELFVARIAHDAKAAVTSFVHSFGGERFLAGHFPGYPVVPGVILLDGMIYAALCNIERAAESAEGGVKTANIETVAFYRPILPGMNARFSARLDAKDESCGSFAFKCSVTVGAARHVRANIRLSTRAGCVSPSH